MTTCPKCGTSYPGAAQACPSCGTRAPRTPSDRAELGLLASAPGSDPAAVPSRLSRLDGNPSLESSVPLSMPESVPSQAAARAAFSTPPVNVYQAGSLIASRYRIVSLLGRGGMGEVYRADDLTLNQPVALKVLSRALMNDATNAQHLINEVKIARRVSHPNVCRVHDVGQFDGTYFISMELIDGEDLGTLIRRAGRLPGERAVAVARQICSGLAAAHDKGVLHRDLKPTNILIDQQGIAHIADFGLAGLAAEIATDGSRAGTPAYMSPEQLTGGSVGPPADIYALGLVLYEIFAGKPVFRPKDMPELLEMHERGVTPPSIVAPDVDAAAETIIMRCLSRDAAARPQNPLLVAAGLPGGSLISAALEAGLTLSPGLIAAAGAKGLLRWPVALGIALLVTLALAASIVLSRRSDLIAYVPLQRSAEVLSDRARSILHDLGYRTDSPHEISAFDYYEELLDELKLRDRSTNWWDQLRKPRPSPIDFWYRQHVRPMVTTSPEQRVSMRDPAPVEPGMIAVRMDPRGRLRELIVVTAGLDTNKEELTDPTLRALPAGQHKASPEALFSAAGLDIEEFKPATSAWIPAVYADERFTYEGVYPDNPQQGVRVETAFFRGWPVAFRLIETRLESASEYKTISSSWRQDLAALIQFFLVLASTVGAVLLAWNNLKNKRGDRDGAVRLAVWAWIIAFVSFVLRADHAVSFDAEMIVLQRAVTYSVFVGASFWLYYIAVEPFARRYWPETLVAWTRLLRGRWNDPLVGQSLLIGALAGVLAAILSQLHAISPMWLGLQPRAPLASPDTITETLQGGRLAIGVIIRFAIDSVRFSLFYLMGIVLLRLILNARLGAIFTYAAIHAVVWAFSEQTSWISWVFAVALAAIATTLVIRFGVLALSAAAGVFLVIASFPMTLDLTAWYLSSTLLAIGAIAVCVVFGVIASTGALRPRITA